MKVHPIYTEDNDCQDCYKCVRECPVKAIKIKDQKASIISDRCIYCGHCTTICPSGAKKVREDINSVNYFFKKGHVVVAALAPSYKSEFPNWSDGQLIKALKSLGFDYVSETALGAEMVSVKVNEWMDQRKTGAYISSCCPVVIDLILNHYPALKENILPVMSPMLAHGKYLKNLLGNQVKVVFIGPCIAKKMEAEVNAGYIDTVITFEKLRNWMEQEKICPEDFPVGEADFYPRPSGLGTVYPIDGGMITSLNRSAGVTSSESMCFSGLDNIIELLGHFEALNARKKVFLELMSCRGGCVNGPAASGKGNTALKRIHIIESFNDRKEVGNLQNPPANFELAWENVDKSSVPEHKYSQEELSEALRTVGKYSQKDELNCSGCGYASCNDFARAMLDHIAEPAMCVSYMRKTAQRQASLLMQKMPYAVVLVNDQLKVVESNHSFAVMLGEDFELAFEHNPGLNGLDLKKMLPSYKHFASLLRTGEELLEKDIQINKKTIHHSIFTIHRNKLVCGMLHSFNTPDIVKAEISKRAKQVIKKNLKTVQKIALLLGENASETEGLLNSLVNIENEG